MSHRIHAMSVAKVYPLSLAKVAKKRRTKEDLDAVIFWLTGPDAAGLDKVLAQGIDFERFFADAPALTPALNPARDRVTGVICGVRIEEIGAPLMREIRVLDMLVDELAKGRPLAKVLRQA